MTLKIKYVSKEIKTLNMEKNDDFLWSSISANMKCFKGVGLQNLLKRVTWTYFRRCQIFPGRYDQNGQLFSI